MTRDDYPPSPQTENLTYLETAERLHRMATAKHDEGASCKGGASPVVQPLVLSKCSSSD